MSVVPIVQLRKKLIEVALPLDAVKLNTYQAQPMTASAWMCGR